MEIYILHNSLSDMNDYYLIVYNLTGVNKRDYYKEISIYIDWYLCTNQRPVEANTILILYIILYMVL